MKFTSVIEISNFFVIHGYLNLDISQFLLLIRLHNQLSVITLCGNGTYSQPLHYIRAKEI